MSPRLSAGHFSFPSRLPVMFLWPDFSCTVWQLRISRLVRVCTGDAGLPVPALEMLAETSPMDSPTPPVWTVACFIGSDYRLPLARSAASVLTEDQGRKSGEGNVVPGSTHTSASFSAPDLRHSSKIPAWSRAPRNGPFRTRLPA